MVLKKGHGFFAQYVLDPQLIRDIHVQQLSGQELEGASLWATGSWACPEPASSLVVLPVLSNQ